MADEPRDALRRLEQRLTSASDAAERLIAEAARTARARQAPAGGLAGPTPSDRAPRQASSRC